MARCNQCGNDYDKSFVVVSEGKTYTFDSFECAITMLAPTCAHCGTKIVGHGMETPDQIFCCSHCAEAAGVHGFSDRIRTGVTA